MAASGPDDPDGDRASEVTAADTPRTRAAAELGALPSRFTVKGTLGEGGMGTVVEAYDRVLGRDVAIKVLGRESYGDPTVATRFLREARAAAQLRHPGIVQVHDIDPDGDFIVMELVRGESLSVRLAREKRLPVAEVRRIGTALLDALGVAHAAGIVHRDVKPANVLLGESGEVKLADFGVAFFGDSDLTMPGTRIGTPLYMAPEQLRARDVDARADVYSAGATLYEAATGKRLHGEDGPKDPGAIVFEVTGDRVLARSIARAVHERAVDRYSDARAFSAALNVTDVQETPPPKPGRRRAVTAAAGVLVAALGVGGFAALRHSGEPASPVGAARSPTVAAKHRTIALLPFADRTHNPLLDFAAAGLPNLLGLELHGIPDVTVIGYYQMLSNVSGPEAPPADWVAAARRLGADVLVRGELTTSSESSVHLVISVDTASGERMDAIERDAPVDGVPEIVRGAAARVAKATLGHDVSAAGHSPTSFAAERELQLGIAELEREKIAEGVEYLRNAVAHDPNLALAHFYYALGLYWQVPPAGPARDEIDRALAFKLDDAQRGFLKALRHLVDQDHLGAIELLRPLAERYPDDKDILYELFEALFHGGQPAEAMSMYRRLVTIAPRFRLALVHCFTFYISHADEAGMTWALGLADPAGDPYNALWEPRILVARREYDAAIRLLSRMIDESPNPGTAVALQSELVPVYALADQLDLALALARKLGESNASGASSMMFGLSAARGDEAGRARWLDVWMRSLVTSASGPARHVQWEHLAGAALRSATPAELTEIATQVDATVVPDFDRSVNLNTVQVMLAEALGKFDRVTALANSPYLETSGAAAAAIASRAGDHAKATSAMRRSIAASGEARFIIDQWALLASELRAAGDHAGVIAACDEVIRPRLFSWAWGSTVGPCLAWTAEAAEALGHPADARVAWRRLIALRSSAPSGDPLLAAARAALGRLGP